MHKYRVDGVLGSSWHPWLRDGISELPIQEDETALSVYLLAQHYTRTKNLELVESLYNTFIEPASDFMSQYIDSETGLPSESYDLWEEKFGSSTYTSAAVYAALQGAAELSALLGKREQATRYRNCAESIKRAILTHLYDVEKQIFIKLIRTENGHIVRDTTLDMSSLYGIVRFNVLDSCDLRVVQMASHIEDRLESTHGYAGYIRYEGDRYYSVDDGTTANPWCITTLWMAQYYIRVAHTKKELEKAYTLLLWVRDRATQNGVLPEQINPFKGAHLSTAPLVWSHAEFVISIDAYVQKYNSLRS
jgi:GH15 family glucan-1,4-alpha-glucosidase